jgi:hypothetical protein
LPARQQQLLAYRHVASADEAAVGHVADLLKVAHRGLDQPALKLDLGLELGDLRRQPVPLRHELIELCPAGGVDRSGLDGKARILLGESGLDPGRGAPPVPAILLHPDRGQLRTDFDLLAVQHGDPSDDSAPRRHDRDYARRGNHRAGRDLDPRIGRNRQEQQGGRDAAEHRIADDLP